MILFLIFWIFTIRLCDLWFLLFLLWICWFYCFIVGLRDLVIFVTCCLVFGCVLFGSLLCWVCLSVFIVGLPGFVFVYDGWVACLTLNWLWIFAVLIWGGVFCGYAFVLGFDLDYCFDFGWLVMVVLGVVFCCLLLWYLVWVVCFKDCVCLLFWFNCLDFRCFCLCFAVNLFVF